MKLPTNIHFKAEMAELGGGAGGNRNRTYYIWLWWLATTILPPAACPRHVGCLAENDGYAPVVDTLIAGGPLSAPTAVYPASAFGTGQRIGPLAVGGRGGPVISASAGQAEAIAIGLVGSAARSTWPDC